MKSRALPSFWTRYESLPLSIREKADLAYELFAENPRHPSLQYKKVHPTQPIYSARIDLKYRAVGVVRDDTVYWFWIGPHDEYDALIARGI